MADEKLLKKLLYKPQYKTLALNAPHSFLDSMAGILVDTDLLEPVYDFIQLFAHNIAEVDTYVPKVLKHIRPDGLLWIAYPKKTGAIKTDIHRDKGWDTVYQSGWEGVSLVSLDDTWSSMRFRPMQGASSRTERMTQPAEEKAKKLKDPGVLEFDAVLEQDDKTTGTGIVFPYSLEETFGTKAQVKVKGAIEGKEFRASIAPYKGAPMLGVPREFREAIGKKAGDKVHIVLSLDKEERMVEVPEDLAHAMAEHPAAKAFFDGLAFTHRKEYVRWITEAKKQETRDSRLAKAIEMLTEGKKRS